MLWVWIGVVAVAIVVLGLIGYGLMGALTRLRREVEGAQRDLQPVLEQLQATAVHAGSGADRQVTAPPIRGGTPGRGAFRA